MASGDTLEFAETGGWPSAVAWVVALALWTGVVIPLMKR